MPCNWILSELNSDECTSSDLNSDNCNSCDLNSSSAVEKWCKFGRCESKSGWSCLLTPGGRSHIVIIGALPIVDADLQPGHSSCREAFPPVLAAYVTSDGHLGRDRSWTVWRFPSEDFTKLIYHPLITRREIFSIY